MLPSYPSPSSTSQLSIAAFLLTRQWRDTRNGIQLDLWFASDDGPVRVVVASQESVFFIRQHDLSSVRQARLKIRFRSGEAKFYNANAEQLLPLYCSSQKDSRELRRWFESKGIPVWEGDIRPPERFLMERFVTAGAEIVGTPKRVNGHLQFDSPSVKQSSYCPKFRTVSLDIETSMDATQLFSIAVYADDVQQIFMVGGEESSEAEYAFVGCQSQKHCLEAFFDWFLEYDPDVIIGWNVVQFDLSVLDALCRKKNVEFAFGRGGARCHWRDDHDDGNRRYLTIPGRVVLDGIEVLKAATYNFPSFALENVSREFLGEGKLLHSNQRGDQISQLFEKDKLALARYNLKDCELVWDIFKQAKLIEFAIERSQLTGLLMDRMGGSVAAFEYAYLPHLHRRGYIAPNLGELQSDVVSPGGYVMNSKPGIFKNVLVLDFKSLYPSIILTFKIDPYGCWYAQHNDIDADDVVPGFNGVDFSKSENILPGIIQNLWQARDKAKADSNEPLSQAIKIIMNSFYGVLGSTGCRFFDPRICSSITLRGHEIIRMSRDWIEEQGHKVIYGDTDSVFVWVGDDCQEDEVRCIGTQLATDLNERWEKQLNLEYGIDSSLEIEFETHYLQFLMPTIRGSSLGSKKRYAGTVRVGDKSKLVFKGLENVRTDWTDLAKKFQEDLYNMVFEHKTVESYVRAVVEAVRSGSRDESLVYRKRLRRKLEDYQKSSPPHVQAARKLVQWNNEKIGRGDWISYVLTVNGPEPEQCRQSPIDYDHYIDKQLQPIADGVLQFVGQSFAQLAAPQLTLFDVNVMN